MRKLGLLVLALTLTVLSSGAALNCRGDSDCEVFCFDDND
jgi:hypothetical protein